MLTRLVAWLSPYLLWLVGGAAALAVLVALALYAENGRIAGEKAAATTERDTAIARADRTADALQRLQDALREAREAGARIKVEADKVSGLEQELAAARDETERLGDALDDARVCVPAGRIR